MAKKKESTNAVATWDEELAEAGRRMVERHAVTASGKYFSTRGGILSYGGDRIAKNQVGAIILADAFVNSLYEDVFDADKPSSPTCFAVGMIENDLTPSAACENPQCDVCAKCPSNKFGSALRGKGKRCKNNIRLALIVAGNYDKDGRFTAMEDPEDIRDAEIIYLSVPATSIEAFTAYVRALYSIDNTVAYGVYTKISLEPHVKHQFHVTFNPIGKVSPDFKQVIKEKVAVAETEVLHDIPKFTPAEEEKPAKKPAKKPVRNKKGKF